MAMPKDEHCDLRSFLGAILVASEKAANIARCCRAEEQVFSLLIQEKSTDAKNSRFLQDFKTLADVLVQEAVRHDLCKQFPGMGQRVQGEESNLFTNTLGETICVQVLSTEDDTAALLSKVLDGNKSVAQLLAKAVFQETTCTQDLSRVEGRLDLANIGIWIDPIDSTSEYIHGNREEPDSTGLVKSGLQCTCVLIGAYDVNNGSPQMGVINQPFYEFDHSNNEWSGRCYWGICTPSLRIHTPLDNPLDTPTASSIWRPQRTIVVSASESASLIGRLQERYRILPVAGAGYKLLAVARGLADIYLLSKGSTYLWDTCGPHALLRSIREGGESSSGGGVVSFRRIMEIDSDAIELDALQISYKRPEISSKDAAASINTTSRWCNFEGVLAYTSVEALLELVQFLRGVQDKYSEMEETAL